MLDVTEPGLWASLQATLLFEIQRLFGLSLQAKSAWNSAAAFVIISNNNVACFLFEEAVDDLGFGLIAR